MAEAPDGLYAYWAGNEGLKPGPTASTLASPVSPVIDPID
jgi:hypothetical protein